jgi:hypothetical protein
MYAYAPDQARLPAPRSRLKLLMTSERSRRLGRGQLQPRCRTQPYEVIRLMKKPTKVTGNDPMMGFRAAPALRASIVRWAETQPDRPSPSEALRRLVEIGLTSKARSRQQQSAKAAKADEMASRQLDRLADQTATTEEQASRKRRLLKGPEEFQGSRVDRRNKAKQVTAK